MSGCGCGGGTWTPPAQSNVADGADQATAPSTVTTPAKPTGPAAEGYTWNGPGK